MTTAPSPPAPLYLIDDETMPATSKAPSGVPIRVRVWAGVGQIPVVLAEPLTDRAGTAPPRVTTRAADFAFGPLLGHPKTGMRFFERSDGAYWHVTFGNFGPNAHRVHHADPRRGIVRPTLIERLIGGPIGA